MQQKFIYIVLGLLGFASWDGDWKSVGGRKCKPFSVLKKRGGEKMVLQTVGSAHSWKFCDNNLYYFCGFGI